MKKLKMIALAVWAGLMCVACTPKKEKLLCAYEEACKNGDAIEAMRVVGEMEKEFGSMEALDSVYTGADLVRLETASSILEQKAAQQAMDQLGGALDMAGQVAIGLHDDEEDEDYDEDYEE